MENTIWLLVVSLIDKISEGSTKAGVVCDEMENLYQVWVISNILSQKTQIAFPNSDPITCENGSG